jgi:hypothetical protein
VKPLTLPRNALNCKGAASHCQPVDVLDAAACSWRNSARSGSTAGTAACLLPRSRRTSLHGHNTSRQCSCLARRRLSVRQHDARGGPAGPLSALYRHGNCPNPGSRRYSFCGARGAVYVPGRPSRIPRSSLSRLTLVSRWLSLPRCIIEASTHARV